MMKKIMMGLFLTALILVVGCTQSLQPQPSSPMPVPGGKGAEMIVIEEQVLEGQIDEHQPEEPLKEMQAKAPTEVIKEFTMTAKRWEFIPEKITVNKGDTVKITVTSIDVAHGFSLGDFGIDKRLEPNIPVTVEFVADKAGTFGFMCNIPCGSGHSSMDGKLVVK